MIEICNDEVLTLSVQHDRPLGDGETLLLSFTGIGHRMGGIDVQRLEFVGYGRLFDNVAFITDKTRSWGNRISLEEIGRQLALLIGRGRAIALGNSMGGFLAIAATAYLPIETVVAFVPQFTIDEAVAPIKPRWRAWLGDISTFRLRDLSAAFQPGCHYWIFSGGSEVDRAHARLFPRAGNIHHFVFPHAPHGLAFELKALDALYPAISASFAGTLKLSDLCGWTGMDIGHLSPPEQ